MTTNRRHIAALSPSGIFTPEKLDASVKLIESWGHRIYFAPNFAAKHRYTAGTEEQRLQDFIWALEHPDIDTIWFIRGGYGTAQLLERLPPYTEKTIIGFSDATALLSHGSNLQWPNLYHGPVLNSLASLCDKASIEAVRHFLDTNQTPAIYGEHAFGPTTEIHGSLVGGNLCVLASLCGTPYQLNADGCILALEDIAEPLYKIDRMLLQLEQSGLFVGVKAILMGSYHNCSPPIDATYSLLDVFRERLTKLNIPVYINAPFGHNEVNWIWRVGQEVRLAHDPSSHQSFE